MKDSTMQHAACLALATGTKRAQIVPELDWSAAMVATERLYLDFELTTHEREKFRSSLAMSNDTNKRRMGRIRALEDALNRITAIASSGEISCAWILRVVEEVLPND